MSRTMIVHASNMPADRTAKPRAVRVEPAAGSGAELPPAHSPGRRAGPPTNGGASLPVNNLRPTQRPHVELGGPTSQEAGVIVPQVLAGIVEASDQRGDRRS